MVVFSQCKMFKEPIYVCYNLTIPVQINEGSVETGK
jgi:hypothetical protein